MSSAGIEAEAGGTAMTQTLNEIEKAVEKGGETLNTFARVAGMSSDEFASTWQGSPMQAIQAFVSGLGGMASQGESTVFVLEELGLNGIRQSSVLNNLSLTASKLSGAVRIANNAWNEDLALTSEANKRYATTESKLAMLNNAYSNLKVAIGDVYTPALKKAADIGIDALGGLTEFVEKNPVVVKMLTAATIGIGTFAVGLGGYVVVSNLATKATAALSAAMSANPYLLAGAAIVGLVGAVASLATTTIDNGIPSVNELTEAAREMDEAMAETRAAYDETVTSTMAAAGVADHYIGKLEQMGDYALLSSKEQQEYRNTLSLLCQVVPELSQYIDIENGAIQGGTAALRANTEAWKQNAMQQAYQEQLASMYSTYADVLIEAQENSIGLTKAEYDLEMAEKELADTQAKINEMYAEASKEARRYNEENDAIRDASAYLTEEYYDLVAATFDLEHEMNVARGTILTYEEAIAESAEATAAAEEEIALAQQAVGELMGIIEEGAGLTGDLSEESKNLQLALSDVNAEVVVLNQRYSEAFLAAQESIGGQYALWDEAAKVVEVSAGTINSNLESQIGYWQNYNSNLQSLTDRGADIEGLTAMIATFADGSQESVNAIAGMASASDADLALMVENWKLLQQEQDNAAAGVADMKTDFTATMDELQADIVADVQAMNLGDEAATSGINTMQGFINGASSMMPQVQAAYARLGQAAIDALNAQMEVRSPSRVTMWTGQMAAEGFIGGAESMKPETQKAYSDLAEVGAKAMRQEVQMVTFAPDMLASLKATSAQPIYAASQSGGSLPVINVTYNVNSNGGTDLTNQLSRSVEDIREVIRGVMEDVDEDRRRRSYL